jgi:hypothetical protein
MAMTLCLEVLTHRVEVLCDDAAAQPILRALLSGYSPASGRPDLRYRFSRSGGQHSLQRDGEEIYSGVAVQDALDRFELDLYRRVVALPDHFVMHAAAVERDGRCLVFAGASGSGKSTMTRALVQRGFRYCTEEVVAIAGDGTLRTLHRPLHLSSPAECADLPPGFGLVQTLHEPPLWLGLPAAPVEEATSLAALIHLRHDPRMPTELVRLKGAAALQAFWECRLNTGLRSAEIASSTLSRVPCYELQTRDVDSAVAAVSEL